ncbi:MAG: hypothetical protein U0670_22355 [Anaerolineae bacterium]
MLLIRFADRIGKGIRTFCVMRLSPTASTAKTARAGVWANVRRYGGALIGIIIALLVAGDSLTYAGWHAKPFKPSP